MDSVLSAFIQAHRADDRETHYNFVSTLRPKGRYLFDRAQLEELMKLYCKRLNDIPNMMSGLGEMPQEYSMLVVDADIKKTLLELEEKYKTDNEGKNVIPFKQVDEKGMITYNYLPPIYTELQVRQVIAAYQFVMQQLTRDFENNYAICILLEKKPYISDDYLKSGFHLAFINYFCEKSMMDTYLIPRVVDKVNEMRIFHSLGFANSSDVLDISKKMHHSKPWMMYGSRKNEYSGFYQVTRAFGMNGVEISLDEAFRGYQLFDHYQRPIDISQNRAYHYPRIFSVNPTYRKVVEIAPTFDPRDVGVEVYQDKKNSNQKPDLDYEERMKLARELVPLLSAERAENHDLWIEVGWVLKSISEGSEEGLQLWNDFSMNCPEKFNDADNMRRWAKMYIGNFKIGRLKQFAKEDSPEEYRALMSTRFEARMDEASMSRTHNDLAKALYEQYSEEFVCVSKKKNLWFQYRDHHWMPCEEGIELSKKISDDLAQEYYKKSGEFLDNSNNIGNEGKNKDIMAKFKMVSDLIIKLKTNSFKNSIMKECAEVFYDREFLRKLGQNKYLIGLKNGVYDLKEHKFREGRADDYIYHQLPIYFREYNENDPWVIETQTFFEKVIVDDQLRDYFLDRMAEVLIGGNKRKHVYFWTGRGNAGKSMTMELFSKMLGEYCKEVPNSIFVGDKPKTGQACPELARTDKGVRLVCTQEPNKKDRINTGAIKEYSGNDRIFVRGLYEDGGEMLPLFKMVMICNDLPEVTNNDLAFWNRVRVIEFGSKFAYNAPVSEDEQFEKRIFPRDDLLGEKFEHMVEPLFWMLVQRLKKIPLKIKEPACVTDAGEKYRRSQDVYSKFIDERIIVDEKGTVNINEMYVSFKDWHKSTYNSGRPLPSKDDMFSNIADMWGNAIKFSWPGYRLRQEKDDIAEGKAEKHTSFDLSKQLGKVLGMPNGIGMVNPLATQQA
jgi:P4 family phage/plasmid primase-like protien